MAKAQPESASGNDTSFDKLFRRAFEYFPAELLELVDPPLAAALDLTNAKLVGEKLFADFTPKGHVEPDIVLEANEQREKPRLVLVHLEITLAGELQREPAVLRQLLQHVVEERDRRVDRRLAPPVQVELEHDLGLARLPLHPRHPSRRGRAPVLPAGPDDRHRGGDAVPGRPLRRARRSGPPSAPSFPEALESVPIRSPGPLHLILLAAAALAGAEEPRTRPLDHAEGLPSDHVLDVA